MNFEQVELQMDSVLHSLRQRFRRASVPSSSGGGAADSSVPSSPGPSAATTQLGSLPSSAAASPFSRRDRSAQQQKGLRRSLHSRASLRRLLRGRLFGDDEEEPASGSRAEAGSRGSGAQKEAEASRLPSEENMAWTAPVSPQSQARTLTPRRRNSARLRELQRLLRAYHEQREAWQSPPTSPRAPRRGQSSRSSGRQSRNESSAAESPQTPRMASTLSNGRESRLPPAAQPLHYSPFEMGTGHPLVFSGSPHLGGDWPMSPKLSAKRRPVVEARQRISLSQLELALRGGQQPEPVTVWSSTASSSPPLSSSLSPSPLLPPKPTAPSSREQRGPSPPILKSARREWQGQKQQQAAEEEGRSASPQYFRRVQSPRPEVHFQQRVVPLGHSPLEYAQKPPPPPPPIAKERKQQKAAKETTKMKTAQQTGQQQTKASDGIATTAAVGSSSSNLFSPAGIQQLLFRHKRERGQSETREKKSAAKQQRSGTGHQGQAEDGRRSLLLVKPARSEPRLAGGGAARSSALSMRNSLASSLVGLSLSASTTALEHLERLKDRVTETKYVTAVFESRGGFGPVLEDVQTELEHWLGARSRLLAVACEVHWSVPERFRSRQLEIQLKESLHATLRENNRRILELNTSDVEDYPGLDDHQSWLRSRPTPFPMTLAKSRTEESCTRDAESDAFQGVYRRFYPALLSLQDEETVRAHQGYWSLENLTDGSRCPLVSNPGRFLWSAQPGQLARKSLVAVNMAVLRLRGDNFDYDKAANAEQKPTAVAKRKSIKQSFF